jgi:ubiquinone/menaquinone biosynthesis C-methylase UbiE
VLDLGVGPGAGAVAMARAEPGKRHVGLDVSGAMLRRAAARARAEGVPLPLVQGDALRLPIRDGALDGATGHSFLYLLDDPAAALAEVRRVLRPGGLLVLADIVHHGHAAKGIGGAGFTTEPTRTRKLRMFGEIGIEVARVH